MNDAHLHLLVNHFPIIGLIIGTVVLLFGIILKSVVTRKVALAILFFAALFSIPSFSSGEGAEEVIEHSPAMNELVDHLIHEHEEKAETFMIFAWSIMLLSLVSLFGEWKAKSFAKYLSITTLIVAFIACFFAKEVGTSGGEIAHPEIRKEFKMSKEEHED